MNKFVALDYQAGLHIMKSLRGKKSRQHNFENFSSEL